MMITFTVPEENERTVTEMDEYIKREAAIAALNKVRDDQRVFKYATASDFLSARDAIERAIKVIESLPAADVEPVRHGRWVSVPHKLARVCSVCNRDEPYKFADIDADVYDYCPNCGARMNEEADHAKE